VYTISGIVLFGMGILSFAYYLAFLAIRFGLGFCGGYKEKRRKLTRAYKHSPTVIFSLGGVLFVIGIIMNISGSSSYMDRLTSTTTSLVSNGQEYQTVFQNITDTLHGVNNSQTYTSNGTTYTFEIDGDPTVELSIWNQIWLNTNGSATFSTYLSNKASSTKTMIWVFFTAGILNILIWLLAYIRKLPSFTMGVGLFNGPLIAFAWAVCAVYFSVMMMGGDVCTQVTNIAVNGSLPKYGNGTSYYFNCFSSDVEQNLGEEQFDTLWALNSSLFIFKNDIQNINNPSIINITDFVNNINTVQDCQNVIEMAPYNSNTTLVNWVNSLMVPLYNTLGNIMDLMNCRYVIQFAVTAEDQLCLRGLNDLQVAFAGQVIVAIAFTFFSIGAIMARNVYIGLKEQRETMISRSDLVD